MLRLAVSRILSAVPVLLVASIVAFTLLRLAPGDPALMSAGLEAPPEVLAQIRADMRLDEPIGCSTSPGSGIWCAATSARPTRTRPPSPRSSRSGCRPPSSSPSSPCCSSSSSGCRWACLRAAGQPPHRPAHPGAARWSGISVPNLVVGDLPGAGLRLVVPGHPALPGIRPADRGCRREPAAHLRCRRSRWPLRRSGWSPGSPDRACWRCSARSTSPPPGRWAYVNG